MGRGDRRTRKGKIWRGSFGKSRPKDEGSPQPKKAPEPKVGKKS